MTISDRNKIIPHMSDYDSVGDQWVPYLMRFDAPSRRFNSVTTDKWGFRNSVGRNGETINLETFANLSATCSANIVIGSSAVFGVGATQDKFSLPSLLNQITSSIWLNFGGRALNSTQELILFMLHLPTQVERIMVFSGVNNITLAYLSKNTSPVYNSFFSQSIFERSMAAPPEDFIGLRRAIIQLNKEIIHKFWPKHILQPKKNIEFSYQNAITCFNRDLRALKAIATGLGVPLYFALQPLASWLNKPLAAEEREIFRILDSMSMDWQVLSDGIVDVRDKYFTDVAQICNNLSIPYVNLNTAPEFLSKDWLFVDRVHLTDLGYEVAAKILKREFNL